MCLNPCFTRLCVSYVTMKECVRVQRHMKRALAAVCQRRRLVLRRTMVCARRGGGLDLQAIVCGRSPPGPSAALWLCWVQPWSQTHIPPPNPPFSIWCSHMQLLKKSLFINVLIQLRYPQSAPGHETTFPVQRVLPAGFLLCRLAMC